ncbi:hypothetical protein E2562_025847 [Oryza meyeriana var. granulata]|uniref:DUF3511 domain-containing protein n=1 Tax=Oryza meyeriana var. granulata TaxID=110450 RepID=A0A6G1E1Z8_9ORYZ|nr:hypothetical protein E2562_025847 [Oryza meyeriana var. granulata]KAF0918727.1 hypothetical protein E2562_025847 [Oryza meyeriana var. granulata]
MADLHHTYRGDSFHPSSASSVPRDATALPPPAPGNGPEATDATEQDQPPPRFLFAMAPTTTAPSTPPPGAFRRCGGRVRGVCVGCFGDPEAKRRRRVAGYKAYAVEGKVKASLRQGIRWFKRKCSSIFRV